MENAGKTKWVIDPTHSEIAFRVKHLMITHVKGVFKNFNATAFTSGNNFVTHEISFSMNPASVDTGTADRDAHLRSSDFFDAEKFGEISFTGTSAEKTGEDSFSLWGNLTIKGITNQVKLDVEFNGLMKDPWGNDKAGYSVNGKINRRDWGLNWNVALEAGGVLVSEEVRLNCDIQLVKQS